MKLHRFIGEYDLSNEKIEIEDREHIRQIKGVLRLGIDDYVILCDGKGKEAKVKIIDIQPGKIVTLIEEALENENPDKKVSLYLAILKKENFELATQKAVECGVSRIIPVITERTIKTGLNHARLQKIILEATEQSGRSVVPEILETMTFKEALADGLENEEKIIFHFVDQVYTSNPQAKSASIFVGPEGGFTTDEISEAEKSGYTPTSLGALTLRGETAAIVATYLATR